MDGEESSNRPSIGVNISEITGTSETHAPESAKMEEMERKIRALINENNALNALMPRVRGKEGEDVVKEMTKLSGELLQAKAASQQLGDQFAKNDQEHARFRRKVTTELEAKDRKIAEMVQRAEELEKENQMLKKEVEDEKSRLYNFQQRRNTLGEDPEVSFRDELMHDVSDVFPNLLSKTMASHVTERSANDLEYTVGQMMGVIGQLDSKEGEAEELRKRIVGFLRAKGHTICLRNVESIARRFEEKLNVEREGIRDTNQELAGEYRDNTEMRLRVMELSQADSSFNTSQRITSSFRITRLPSDPLTGQLRVLRGVCNELFGKLQGTARFLQGILEGLGDSEEARELIRRITDINLDLNKSIGEAQQLAEAIDNELSIAGEASAIDMDDEAANREKIEQMQQELSVLRNVQDQYDTIKATLNKELVAKQEIAEKLGEYEKEINELKAVAEADCAAKEEHSAKVAELQQMTQVVEHEKETLIEKLNDLESQLEAKEIELQHEKANFEAQLASNQDLLTVLGQQKAELQQQVRELESLLGTKNSEMLNLDHEKRELEARVCQLQGIMVEKGKENVKLDKRFANDICRELERIHDTLKSAASSSKGISHTKRG